MLSLYFQKAADMKPKVIRQVLMTIVRFVTGAAYSHKEAGHVVSDLIESATFTSLSMIYSENRRSNTRVAMNLCEIFLAKQLISVNLFCQAISKARSCAETCEDYDFGEISGSSVSSRFVLPSNLIEDLVAALVGWVRYADTAPSSGRLLKRLFVYLQNHIGRDLLLSERSERNLPLWVRPLKQTVLLHPDLLEAIGNHILPDLLQISYAESLKFLDSLPLFKLSASDVTDISEEDIQFCLSIVAILRQKGLDQLIADLRLHSPDESIGIAFEPMEAAHVRTSGESLNIKKLSMRFLDHGNSSISITSLSILTFSSSHTKPFSEETLASLEQSLPLFHAESDSKFRGEFISIMRRVLRRFDSTMIRLSHIPIESRHLKNSIATSSWSKIVDENDRLKIEELHRSFLNWYNGYLAQELQPTASYQRHITALRVLQIMQTGMLLDTILKVRLLPLLSTRIAESVRLVQVYYLGY